MTVPEDILQMLRTRQRDARPWLSSSELANSIDTSWSTVKRQLDVLLKTGMVQRLGRGRATRYRIADPTSAWALPAAGIATRLAEPAPDASGMIWSEPGQALLAHLRQPLASRAPVGYQRSFVDECVPNHSSRCLPPWPRAWPTRAACRASSLPAPTRAACWSRCCSTCPGRLRGWKATGIRCWPRKNSSSAARRAMIWTP